jgi:hypothetical protein
LGVAAALIPLTLLIWAPVSSDMESHELESLAGKRASSSRSRRTRQAEANRRRVDDGRSIVSDRLQPNPTLFYQLVGVGLGENQDDSNGWATALERYY